MKLVYRDRFFLCCYDNDGNDQLLLACRSENAAVALQERWLSSGPSKATSCSSCCSWQSHKFCPEEIRDCQHCCRNSNYHQLRERVQLVPEGSSSVSSIIHGNSRNVDRSQHYHLQQ